MRDDGYLRNHFQLPGRDGWAGIPEDRLHASVSEHLKLLCRACWELAPPLHLSQKIFGDAAFAKRIGQ